MVTVSLPVISFRLTLTLFSTSNMADKKQFSTKSKYITIKRITPVKEKRKEKRLPVRKKKKNN